MDRKTALAAGILYLLTFASIPTLALYGPVRERDYVLGAGPDTPVMVGALLEVVVALACVGTAVALYPVVKRENQAMALGFACARVIEAAGILAGVVSFLSIVSLRRAGADAVVAAQALVAQHDWAFTLSQSLMPTVNAVLLGTLLYRARLVPRALPVLGLVGAPLLLAATLTTVFGVNTTDSTWSAVAALPIAVWEFGLGVWLVGYGIRSRTPERRPRTP